MGTATYEKHLGFPMPKQNDDFFVVCQIHVVNRQLFSALNCNNPLAKTALGESYVLMINRHLDGKKNTP